MLRRLFTTTLLVAPIGFVFGQGSNSKREIRPLQSSDVEWLAKADEVGRKVLKHYAQTAEVTPKTLDSAFRNWKADKGPKRAPDRVIAEGLGALFGNYVVKRKVASWAVVTDSFGTDLAVRSPAGRELYPISSVWKRIDPKDGDINFFEPIWTLIAEKQFDDR